MIPNAKKANFPTQPDLAVVESRVTQSWMQYAQACMQTSKSEPMANLPKKILGGKLVDIALCMKGKVFQVPTDHTSFICSCTAKNI